MRLYISKDNSTLRSRLYDTARHPQLHKAINRKKWYKSDHRALPWHEFRRWPRTGPRHCAEFMADARRTLSPFRKPDGSPYISHDCVNIERQLDYTYGTGSLDNL